MSIFPETSDEFFAKRRLEELLEGRSVKLAFIDGRRRFEQCLRDFTNLEAYCDSTSAILLHDTIPLDEPTQRRTRETTFWTGDVWKAVVVLKHYRPDLEIFTIPAGPSGLTVVIGLDPSSGVLVDAYDDAVGRWMETPFAEVEHRFDGVLSIIPNDWEFVASRLTARGILKSESREDVH